MARGRDDVVAGVGLSRMQVKIASNRSRPSSIVTRDRSPDRAGGLGLWRGGGRRGCGESPVVRAGEEAVDDGAADDAWLR